MHPVFTDESISNFVKEQESKLCFINIGDRKIVDLNIKIEVEQNKSFYELYDYVKSLDKNYIEWNEEGYMLGGVLGLEDPEKLRVDVLDGNNEIQVNMPGYFHLLLTSFNLLNQQENNEIKNISINIGIDISYNHVFNNEKVLLNETVPIKLTFTEIASNVLIEWESILLDKK